MPNTFENNCLSNFILKTSVVSVASVANPVFCLLFAFYFVAGHRVSKYNFLCKTNPIFSRRSRIASAVITSTNHDSLTTIHDEERTQTNPIKANLSRRSKAKPEYKCSYNK
jgi:hypothetical protein